MKYKISTKPAESKYLSIEATLENCNSLQIEVQLPAWRPGRYELQNFAKNIKSLAAYGERDEILVVEKITKDRWIIKTAGSKNITIRYEYYANQADAGGSYVDKNLLYINPVNCCVYVEGRITESCQVFIEGNESEELAGGVKSEYVDGFHRFKTDDFYHLADLPFMLSSKMQHKIYKVNDTPFQFVLL